MVPSSKKHDLLPRLRKGIAVDDLCVEFRTANGLHTIDVRCLHGIHTNEGFAALHFTCGLLTTQHSYEEMVELIYPILVEEDSQW